MYLMLSVERAAPVYGIWHDDFGTTPEASKNNLMSIINHFYLLHDLLKDVTLVE